MKRSSLFVLGLFVATCAVGCGTENPTGPSFARTAPSTESQVSTVPISEDPSASEVGPYTSMPEPDAESRGNGQKAKNPNYKRGHEHAPGQQEQPVGEDPFETPVH